MIEWLCHSVKEIQRPKIAPTASDMRIMYIMLNCDYMDRPGPANPASPLPLLRQGSTAIEADFMTLRNC
jgi:hypothetical protein